MGASNKRLGAAVDFVGGLVHVAVGKITNDARRVAYGEALRVRGEARYAFADAVEGPYLQDTLTAPLSPLQPELAQARSVPAVATGAVAAELAPATRTPAPARTAKRPARHRNHAGASYSFAR